MYENTDLFNEENRLDVKVTVSPFRLTIYSNILQWKYNCRRTFQSAIAFVSSFLFPMKGFVDEVKMMDTSYSFLRLNSQIEILISQLLLIVP